MQQGAPTEMERTVRQYTRTLSLIGALIALTQIFISAAAAQANSATVLSVQRTLISLASNGGATPIIATQLGPMFVVTYLAGFITFLLMLLLCWYTARVMTAYTGSRRRGAAVGRRVALNTSLIWIVAAILVATAFHLDGSLSWLLATLGTLLFTPASQLTGGAGVLVTAPGLKFLAFQVVFLLIFDIPAALVAYGFGALASRIGSRSVPERHVAPPMTQGQLNSWLPPTLPYPPPASLDALPYPPPIPPTPPEPAPSAPPNIS